MWEAAEALDDVAVQLGVLAVLRVEVGVERDAAVLIRELLGVLEWQVEEDLEVCGSGPVMAERDGLVGDLACASVANMRGVPRKQLRGNWSSKMSKARAPSGDATQSSSS